jgi:hypothetical protein
MFLTAPIKPIKIHENEISEAALLQVFKRKTKNASKMGKTIMRV